MISRVLGRCGGLEAPMRGIFGRTAARRHFSNKNTFYDSQSGGFISVGGGVNIHDTTYAKGEGLADPGELKAILSRKPPPASVQLPSLHALDDENWSSAYKSNTPVLVRLVGDDDDNLMNVNHKQLDGYVVEVSAAAADVEERTESVSKIEQATGIGYMTLIILRCDLSASGMDTLIATGGVIGDLADAGAKVILLENASGDGDIDESTVEAVLEEGFWLDCSGDPIKQRLGLATRDEKALRMAVSLGVLHFATSSKEGHAALVALL